MVRFSYSLRIALCALLLITLAADLALALPPPQKADKQEKRERKRAKRNDANAGGTSQPAENGRAPAGGSSNAVEVSIVADRQTQNGDLVIA
jgi:hypothetical protein